MRDEHRCHTAVLRSVVRALQAPTPYVLKGVTALHLLRGLPRYSTDLDFDAHTALPIDRWVRAGLVEAGVALLSRTLAKDSPAMHRLRYHYADAVTGADTLLTIKTSLRTPPREETVEIVDGIRTYTIPQITEQKITAFRLRTTGRDLFDLAFLVTRYGDMLPYSALAAIEDATADIDGVADRFREAWHQDPVLQDLHDFDETLLTLRVTLEERLDPRAGPAPPPGQDRL